MIELVPVFACFALMYILAGVYLGKETHTKDGDEYVKAADLFGWPAHVFKSLFNKKQGDE